MTDEFKGLVPPPITRVNHDDEWPKWVEPHASHIVRKETPGAPDHISVPGFPDWHVARETGAVTVLVHNADEEKAALAEYVAPEAPAADPHHQHDDNPQPSEGIDLD